MNGTSPAARFRVVSIVWGSMLVGVTLLTGVVWGLTSGVLTPGFRASLSPGLASMLLLLSPLLMVVGLVYRNGEVDRRGDAAARLAGWQVRMTAASALLEGAGILGLVVCLLAARPAWALGVWALTAAAGVLARPRKHELEGLLR